MSDKRRTFAVIDGNSLMHRAFHAVPPTMNAPDGRPTNAIFGFLNMFLKMIDAFNPDGVVVAFDKGKPRVRMEMLPQYKAQRPPMDPDLHAQFPMIKELLTALNVPILQSEGWEGDDILGTMARLGEEAGCDMLLVSQLLGHSSVSTTMRYIGINTDLMRDAVEATTRADVSECRQREAVTAFMPAKTMQGLTFGG